MKDNKSPGCCYTSGFRVPLAIALMARREHEHPAKEDHGQNAEYHHRVNRHKARKNPGRCYAKGGRKDPSLPGPIGQKDLAHHLVDASFNQLIHRNPFHRPGQKELF